MYIKKHTIPEGGGLLIALCDQELIGKTISNDDIQIHISESFYKGETMQKEQIAELLHRCVNANIVGKKSVALVQELGLVDEKQIMHIDSIPYALFVRHVE